MRPTKKSAEIIQKYVALAKKLNKLPTVREIERSGCSSRQVYNNFIPSVNDSRGPFEILKETALKQFPELVKLTTSPPKEKLKILVFDIETFPIIAKVWGLFDQNVALNQIVKDWSVASWAAKWLGSPETEIMYAGQEKARDVRNDKKILQAIRNLLDQAHIVITQNGIKFDQKKLYARFKKHGIKRPSPFRHIDIYRVGKKHFGFTSYKLEYMADFLGVKHKKLKHKKFPGMEMWNECENKNPEAWVEMEKYNKYDVLVTEDVYNVIKDYDDSINFSIYEEENTCSCGNKTFKKSPKSTFTNTGKFEVFLCKKCNRPQKGKINLINKETRDLLRK